MVVAIVTTYLSLPTMKLSVGDHVSQLSRVLDQVSDLLDKLRALMDTLEGWRSKLKGHEPPHVLPKDVETQLQKLSVSRRFYMGTIWL